MIRLLLCLAVAVLAGCASTRGPAPVREVRAPSRVLAAKTPVAAGHYRVQAGDTLYKIAFQHGVDFRALAAWNKLPDPDRIQIDEVLRVTAPKALTGTAAPPAEPTLSLRPVAPVMASLAEPDEAVPVTWVWPSRGPLLGRFGEDAGKGIDISGARGQVVQAAASGRVVYAGSGLRGYGKLIIIRHGKTLLSAYAHNARLLVAEGQAVAGGQAIAEMGDSDADRVKLHFEIREYGKPVDPLNYLPKLS